jgi:hypothetical protein
MLVQAETLRKKSRFLPIRIHVVPLITPSQSPQAISGFSLRRSQRSVESLAGLKEPNNRRRSDHREPRSIGARAARSLTKLQEVLC